MNTHIRNHLAALVISLPAAVSLVAMPVMALAQAGSPELRSLEITGDADLDAGSNLRIRADGTPRGQATVRIGGVRAPIALREMRPGIYVARYIIKSSDRINDESAVRATLRVKGRTAVASYTVAEAMGGPSVANAPPPPVVVPPRALPAPAALPLPRIDRFTMAALERIEPGAELRFALDGVAGAVVLVDLPGIRDDVALREIRAGHYEGAYTIRRNDSLALSQPIVATLRTGERAVTANLAAPAGQAPADNRSPTVLEVTPRDGEVVPGGQNIQISANFDDRGGSGVDPSSVRVILSGRNATPESQISPNGFTLRANLAPGHHTVDLTARDRAGNAVRREWGFDVAAGATVSVPLQVLNHNNNDTVVGSSTLIQVRTAAFASVTVNVDAIAPLGAANGRQPVYSQTLQADANGNLSFSFSPRILVPGTRYEIDMVSTKANVSNEARLVLFQRQG